MRDRLMNLPPEAFDPERLKPKKRRVLLLASYCDEDDPNCSEEFPCPECLQICNVAEVDVGLDDVLGGFGYLRDKK